MVFTILNASQITMILGCLSIATDEQEKNEVKQYNVGYKRLLKFIIDSILTGFF